MRCFAVAVVVLALTGCAQHRLMKELAQCDVGATIAHTDTVNWSNALVGTFEYVEKWKTELSHMPERGVDTLVLRLASAQERERARVRSIGNRPRDLWLTGRYIWKGQIAPEQAELIGGSVLVLGCSDCFDGSPTYLTPIRVGPKGFAGHWINYMTGNVMNVDRNGKRLPKPEGTFCATRVSSGD